jgi:hypothetical protein
MRPTALEISHILQPVLETSQSTSALMADFCLDILLVCSWSRMRCSSTTHAFTVATAGVTAAFKVVTRGFFGNQLTGGGLRMFLYLQGFLETAFSNGQQNLLETGSGEYGVQYKCRLKRLYYIRALEGCQNCSTDASCKCGRSILPLHNSPVRCLPSIMSEVFTTISGATSLGTMTAGTPKEYSVVARDSYGNIVENNVFVISVSVRLVKAVSSAVSNSSAITIYNFKNVCM